ncbi:MAG: flagellar motor switch protein FliN, partial [SAR324 cluster bacterium]|nr:flagellar motor switch protein FliN [SAR324 cluster bacterium]
DALFDGGGDGGDGDDMESLLSEIQNDPSLSQGNEDVDINDLLTEIQTESPLTGDAAGQEDIDMLMSSVGSAEAGVDAMPLIVEEEGVNVDFLLDMKLTLTFEVGRAKMLIGDLLSLGQGSVIELHRLVGEDLDMFVSGRLIARGEVVVVNEKFGVRILDIISPEDRIKQMAGFDRI